MTNINCSADCIYQSDGKCGLESMAASGTAAYNRDCAYYTQLSGTKEKTGGAIAD